MGKEYGVLSLFSHGSIIIAVNMTISSTVWMGLNNKTNEHAAIYT